MTQYSDDILNAIKSFGLLSYPLPKIINLLPDITGQDDIDMDTLSNDFHIEGSPIHTAYHKGIDMAEYQINKKLFDMAKAGDLDALEKFERRKRLQESDD
jgi:hypothetical protein